MNTSRLIQTGAVRSDAGHPLIGFAKGTPSNEGNSGFSVTVFAVVVIINTIILYVERLCARGHFLLEGRNYQGNEGADSQ